jgi:hypothetical protein
MEQLQQKNTQGIFPGRHPSGLDKDELVYVSMEFWMLEDNGLDSIMSATNEKFNRLLSFQQGWKACKDYYSN